MTGSPGERMAQSLRSLYGEQPGQEAGERLRSSLEAWRPRLRGQGRRSLSERDAFLITYPDQLRQADRLPLETLADFGRQRLAGLMTGIHVLPFYPSSSDDGFSVIDHRAVDPALGSWQELAHLAQHFKLMVDVVLNHASASSRAFQGFLRDDPGCRDFFVTLDGTADLSRVVRPRAHPLLTRFESASGVRQVWTTFSADQVDWNYRNPQVLLELVETLLQIVWRGAELIRLDAVAYLWKEIGTACIHLPQTHQVIQLLRAVLDEVAPHVLLVSETNVPHEQNIAYFGDGLQEAQLVYNFSLPPLVLHTFHQRSASALSGWAAGLQTPGRDTAFLNFLASHDGVGLNPARDRLSGAEIEALVRRTRALGGRVSMRSAADGSPSPYELNINYLDALAQPGAAEPPALLARRFLTAHAIMLSLAGVPAIYFHSLVGSRGWPAGVAASGHNRSINRQKLERGELERELDQPGSLRSLVFQGFSRLLSARSSCPAFHPAAGQTILDCGPHVFGLVRRSDEAGVRVLCLHNVTGQEQVVQPDPAAAGTDAGAMADLLGGGDSDGRRVSLGAWETRWLVRHAGIPPTPDSRQARAARLSDRGEGA